MANIPQTEKHYQSPPSQGVANAAKEKAGEAAKSVGETAKDFASTAVHKAGDAASFVGHKAQEATEAVGSGMKSLAGTIREHTPKDGVFGSASASVASTLESGGRYLEEHGLSGMGKDLTDMVRRNPMPALLIAVGIGFLVAYATRRS